METVINNPLVSVIIPCYNDHLYIGKAIDSVNEQEYRNIEIIIIDDGSNQGAKAILQSINQENLKLLTQENQGPSVARNNGIKASKGEYILTLDADDFFESTFVSKAVAILSKNPTIGFVTCWGKWFDSKNETDIKPTGGDAVSALFIGETCAIGNLMFRKKCWIEVGGYDENMVVGYEDWEFYIAITKRNWKTHVIKEFLFNYRKKENSRNFKANQKDFEIRIYVYKKHEHFIKENFKLFLNSIELEITRVKKSNDKLRASIDYKLGKKILYPFRLIKKILKF